VIAIRRQVLPPNVELAGIVLLPDGTPLSEDEVPTSVRGSLARESLEWSTGRWHDRNETLRTDRHGRFTAHVPRGLLLVEGTSTAWFDPLLVDTRYRQPGPITIRLRERPHPECEWHESPPLSAVQLSWRWSEMLRCH
jgi:hypothetical protein